MAVTNLSLAIVLVTGLSLAHMCAAFLSAGNLEFLVTQNVARTKLSLPRLVWNDTLMAYARSYAIERAVDCALEHSHTQDYGENIATGTGELRPSLVVSMWVGEKADYDYDSNTCQPGKMCGHYTQVVWRNTQSIGCARSRCRDGGTFATCNYYPPGNYVGERPY